MNVRKGTCLLIAVIMLLGIMAPPAFGIAGESPNRYEEEVSLLKELNVLPEKYDGEKMVKRGEFAAMVAKVMFPEIQFSASQGQPSAYTDVKATHQFYAQIRALKDMQVISGDMFSNFYPEDLVTYQDSLTMLVNALGYAKFAQQKGGYPSGYFAIASETGITKGTENGAVDYNKAAKLIYNALFADMVDISAVTADGPVLTVIPGKNILSQRLGITQYDALITNDGFTSLDGEGEQRKDEISIKDLATADSFTFKMGKSDVFLYLGYRVKLYVKDGINGEKGSVLYCSPYSGVKATVIRSDSIIAAEPEYIEYETEKDSGKYQKISLGKAPLYTLINGIKTAAVTKEALKPADGYITFIDNGTDKAANTLLVTSFDYNIILDQVNAANQVIQCLQNPRNNLEYEDEDTVALRLMKDGKQIEPEQLKKLDVLSVAKSHKKAGGKTLYDIRVSSMNAKGKVDGLSESEKAIYLDGKLVKLSPSYLSIKPNLLSQIKVGTEISYCLDIMENIAYIEDFEIDSKGFSYLIDMQQESGVEDDVKIKFFSGTGEIKIASVSGKVTVDGKKLDGLKSDGTKAQSSFVELQDMLCQRSDGTVTIPTQETAALQNQSCTSIVPRPALVKYNAGGEIVRIDTDVQTYSDMSMEQADPDVIRGGIRLPRVFSYSMNGFTFDGSFFLNSNTVILKVPDVDRYNIQPSISRINTRVYSRLATNLFEQDLSDPKNYEVVPLSALSNRMEYDIQAFNVDPYTGAAAYAVIRGRVGYMYNKVNYQAPFYMFLKRTACVDEESGNLIDRIYFTDNGKEKSMAVDRDSLSPWYQNLIYSGKSLGAISNPGKPNETAAYIDVEPLSQGDLIYAEETNGKLSHIQRDLDISRINTKTCGSARSSMPDTPYTSNFYTKTNIDVPFDQRISPSYGYDVSFNMSMGAAMELNSSALTMRVPTRGSTSLMGNFSEYIGKEASATYFDRFIDLSRTKIRLLEETECDVAHDNCKFRDKEGSISDIRTASMYSGDPATQGIYKASRIVALCSYGVYSQITIINLSEEHSKYIH